MDSELECAQPMTAEPSTQPPVIQTPPPMGGSAVSGQPNPLAAVFLYILVVFLGAAIAAPRFYASAQYLAEMNPVWRALANHPFRRFLDRSLLVFALVGLPAFIKALRIPSARALGFSFRARHWFEGAQGAVWGIAALGFAASVALSFAARRLDLDHSAAQFLQQAGTAALVALIVATLEEILFRGALFGSLRRDSGFWRAAILSSAIYALMHFFERPEDPAAVHWYSGFITLRQMLGGFTDWQALIPGFFNLTLIGLILALAFERTGSLLFSIGLHAGLVFGVKYFGFISKPMENANTWAWGSNKLVDGWASGIVLLALFAVLRVVLPSRKPLDA